MNLLATVFAAFIGIFLGCRYHFASKVQPRRLTAEWPTVTSSPT